MMKRWATPASATFFLAVVFAAPLTTRADVLAGTGSPSATTLGESTASRWMPSSGGTGHALIVPYFNTQSGNATLFAISNIDGGNGKAVKIRVRGAANGDTLLSLTVLLGPGDVWTATLRQGSDGRAELVTTDTSCTVPRLTQGVGQSLLTSRLPSSQSTDAKANQTREGYIEILNMADVVYRSDSETPLYVTITPNSATPCDDATIRAAIVDQNYSTEAAAASKGLATPTGGLGGRWLIINVPQTTTFSGEMHALRAADASGSNARANFVLFPQTDGAYGGGLDAVTADPLLRSSSYTAKSYDGITSRAVTGPIQAQFQDLPDLSTPYVVTPGGDAALQQAAGLSSAFAIRTLRSDYLNDPAISAKTDWTFSSPARRYSVATDSSASPARALYSLVPPSGSQFFYSSGPSPLFARLSDGLLCTTVSTQAFYDRNSNFRALPVVQPQPPIERQVEFCGVVGVLAIGDTGNSALSASVTRTDFNPQYFTNGWGIIRLNTLLPLSGHSFMKLTNPAVAPGMSGTYGLTYQHWTGKDPY